MRQVEPQEYGHYFGRGRSVFKSVEEVCSIIQNRVKLYLEENKQQETAV